ncbi:MAG: hypothetical protein M1819_006656 [Sarea resinae]|nr:MAG: hypothetical protein M1819_006656 [Sarea resinae]
MVSLDSSSSRDTTPDSSREEKVGKHGDGRSRESSTLPVENASTPDRSETYNDEEARHIIDALDKKRRQLDDEIAKFKAQKEEEFRQFEKALRSQAELARKKDNVAQADTTGTMEGSGDVPRKEGELTSPQVQPPEASQHFDILRKHGEDLRKEAREARSKTSPGADQTPPHQREQEFRGLFTPLFLPLLDVERHKVAHKSSKRDSAGSSRSRGSGGASSEDGSHRHGRSPITKSSSGESRSSHSHSYSHSHSRPSLPKLSVPKKTTPPSSIATNPAPRSSALHRKKKNGSPKRVTFQLNDIIVRPSDSVEEIAISGIEAAEISPSDAEDESKSPSTLNSPSPESSISENYNPRLEHPLLTYHKPEALEQQKGDRSTMHDEGSHDKTLAMAPTASGSVAGTQSPSLEPKEQDPRDAPDDDDDNDDDDAIFGFDEEQDPSYVAPRASQYEYHDRQALLDRLAAKNVMHQGQVSQIGAHSFDSRSRMPDTFGRSRYDHGMPGTAPAETAHVGPFPSGPRKPNLALDYESLLEAQTSSFPKPTSPPSGIGNVGPQSWRRGLITKYGDPRESKDQTSQDDQRKNEATTTFERHHEDEQAREISRESEGDALNQVGSPRANVSTMRIPTPKPMEPPGPDDKGSVSYAPEEATSKRLHGLNARSDKMEQDESDRHHGRGPATATNTSSSSTTNNNPVASTASPQPRTIGSTDSPQPRAIGFPHASLSPTSATTPNNPIRGTPTFMGNPFQQAATASYRRASQSLAREAAEVPFFVGSIDGSSGYDPSDIRTMGSRPSDDVAPPGSFQQRWLREEEQKRVRRADGRRRGGD